MMISDDCNYVTQGLLLIWATYNFYQLLIGMFDGSLYGFKEWTINIVLLLVCLLLMAAHGYALINIEGKLIC